MGKKVESVMSTFISVCLCLGALGITISVFTYNYERLVGTLLFIGFVGLIYDASRWLAEDIVRPLAEEARVRLGRQKLP